jgi:hypothetical protein
MATLLVLGLAALLVPAVRQELELSVTRKPTAFVELYFGDPTPSGPRGACVRERGRVSVRFVVESHLTGRETLDHRVALDPAPRGLRTRRAGGSTPLDPGEAREITTSFRLPRSAPYVVSVELPQLGQQLRARCPGGARR